VVGPLVLKTQAKCLLLRAFELSKYHTLIWVDEGLNLLIMVWAPFNHGMACMHHLNDGISFQLTLSSPFCKNATIGNEIKPNFFW